MWNNLMNLLVAISLTACQASLSTPEQTVLQPTEPSNLSSMSMDSKDSGLLQTPDSFIRYEVGNPNFHGRTTVEVKGNGSVTVRFQRGSQDDRYTGTLSNEALENLRQTLQTHNPQSLQSSRSTGVPDEARIRFTMGGATESEQVTELWHNEQWNNPDLRSLVVAFTNLAKQVSGGKVQY